MSAGLVTSTVTPGITASDVSRTVPGDLPFLCECGVGASTSTAATTSPASRLHVSCVSLQKILSVSPCGRSVDFAYAMSGTYSQSENPFRNAATDIRASDMSVNTVGVDASISNEYG